jgi:Zn-dependent protease with chaperone function
MGEFSGYDRRDVNHPLRRPQDYTPDGQRRRRWSRPERKVRLTYRRRPVATVLSTIAVVLVTSLVAVGTTRVGSIFTDETYNASGWAVCSTPISWTTDLHALTPQQAAQIRPLIAKAFNAWGTAAGYTFADGGEALVTYDNAKSSVKTVADISRNIAITLVPDAASDRITKQVVGFASPNLVYPGSKEIVGGYIVLSSDYMASVNAAHQYALILHEMGHALGLADSSDPGNVMFGMVDSRGGLGTGDIAGLKDIEKVCTS